ncbi:hypothetical protein GCM10011609_06690 [Lentzea pudingi]|uniref:Uncharacterized protein n=1 Tax=Lentzea pudingi TaxID=1789439 RepID=A0ABQ2HC92_9PSEU|nr:hypothetical protein GCM10011609_06690 [Lentzea pudingi]
MPEKATNNAEETLEDRSADIVEDQLEDLDDLDDVDFDLDEVENKIAPLALAETEALTW